MVQQQYHPDRLRGPLGRDASARGTGAFQSVNWSAGLDSLVRRLSDFRDAGRAGEVALITPPLAAHQAMLVDTFARAYGLQWLSFEPVSDAPLRQAARRVFGMNELPWFDIARARNCVKNPTDFVRFFTRFLRLGELGC